MTVHKSYQIFFILYSDVMSRETTAIENSELALNNAVEELISAIANKTKNLVVLNLLAKMEQAHKNASTKNKNIN